MESPREAGMEKAFLRCNGLVVKQSDVLSKNVNEGWKVAPVTKAIFHGTSMKNARTN